MLQLKLAVVGALQRAQDAQQRRLAGAIPTYEANTLAALEREIGMVKQGHMTEGQLRVEQRYKSHGESREELREGTGRGCCQSLRAIRRRHHSKKFFAALAEPVKRML